MSHAILCIEKIKEPARLEERAAILSSGTRLTGSQDILGDWQRRIDDAGISKIRANAVIAYEFLFTFSEDLTKAMLKNKTADGTTAVELFADNSLNFLYEKFNQENVINAVLYQDDTVPRMHAMVVPEKDGRLNARHFTGGSQCLTLLKEQFLGNLHEGFKQHMSSVMWSKKLHNAFLA